VESLISRFETIATKAEGDKKWLAAAAALREIGRCLRLLGEMSGELSGTTINVSVHLQRSLTVVLGLGPEEFTRFFGTIFKQASEAQIRALLSAEETQDALCVNPQFDSRCSDAGVEQAARQSLSDEERAVLEAINAKLQRFRDEHASVKYASSRIVLNPNGKGAVTAGLEFLNYDKIEREVEKFGLTRDPSRIATCCSDKWIRERGRTHGRQTSSFRYFLWLARRRF
jgi:hypothetical protein